MPETTIAPEGAVGPAAAPRGVRLSERLDVGKLVLRGDPADRGFLAATGRALDIVLPTEANSSAGKGTIMALWVGPDEWLITCPRERVAALMTALREALAGVHAAVTDVSDGRAVFRLAGPSARALLAKGTPLDLHPRVFRPHGRPFFTLIHQKLRNALKHVFRTNPTQRYKCRQQILGSIRKLYEFLLKVQDGILFF